MAKLQLLAGTSSKTVKIFIQDSSKTTGVGLTGLTSGSSGLTCYYIREGANATVAVTLQSATLGTWTTRGFIVVDATNMPGMYELGIPDAAITTGSKSVVLYLQGATNMSPCVLEIELTAVDNQSTAFGLSIAKSTNITGFNDIAASAVVSSGAITTSGGAVSTVTAVTNGVTVTTNNDKTGYALSASQTFNMTGNITGNLSGSVGTVTGGVTVTTNNDKTGYSITQTFPTNFASLAVDVTGQVTVGTNNDKTGYSLTQSFPANFASLAITAGGVASADVKYVNGTQVTGDGQSGTEWGPV